MKPPITMRHTLIACLLGAGWLTAVQGDEQSAARLLPPTTMAYAHLTNPSGLLTTVLEHPTYRWVEKQGGYREAFEQKQFLQFKAVVAVVEAQLGSSWRRILAAAAGDGVFIGFDTKSEGVAVLLKSKDEETPQQIVTTVVGLARADAQNKGGPDPIKVAEHHGIKTYNAAQAHVAVFGRWLAISNQKDLLTLLIDNSFNEAEQTLATQEAFQQARQRHGDDTAAWGYLNMNALREAGIGRSLSRATMDNPLAELLVGGTLSVLQKTPYLTARLQVQPDLVRLQVASPHEAEWVDERREYFFGQAGKGSAPPLLAVDESLFSLSAYRDVSQLWLRAGELFDEKVNDGLAQADSTLSTLFSGKDFGEDILGAVMPEIQLIVARQSFAADAPRPAIKLPSFGLVFRLKEPERMMREMRRTFQSLIGFLNIVGSMNGQPQLDLGLEEAAEYQLVTSTYLPEANQDRTNLPINFNFSPTVGFTDERFIVSSTKDLALQLATSTGVSEPTDAGHPNTIAAANAASIRAVLDDNRSQLVAQNMLEQGHTREEAEREIETLLELLNFVRDASLQLGTTEKTLKLGIELKLSAGDE